MSLTSHPKRQLTPRRQSVSRENHDHSPFGRYVVHDAPRTLVWLVADAIMFTSINIIVSFQVSAISFTVALFLRYLFSIPAVYGVAIVCRNSEGIFAPLSLGTLSGRRILACAVTSCACNACWYFGLQTVPISLATAIAFSKGILLTVLAALFLGERPGRSQWLYCGIGAAGVLLITSPEGMVPDLGTTLVVCSAFFAAITVLQTRQLSKHVSGWSIALGFGIYGAPITFLGALPNWVWPSPVVLLTTMLVGFFAAGIQFAATQTFRRSHVYNIAPFDFLRLAMATAVASLFLATQTSPVAWFGISIISALLAARSIQILLSARSSKQALQRE